MSQDDTPPEEKIPRKNKQPLTWQDWGRRGLGVAGILGVGAAGKVAYHEQKGDIDFVGLRNERTINIPAEEVRVTHSRNEGSKVTIISDEIVEKPAQTIRIVHEVDPAAVKRLLDSGTIDRAEIEKVYGVEKGKEKNILSHRQAYWDTPQVPNWGPEVPQPAAGILGKFVRRFDLQGHKREDGLLSYARRERDAYAMLHHNLLKEGWKLYAETDEGKAFADQLKHSPRDAVLEQLEAVHHGDQEAFLQAGLMNNPLMQGREPEAAWMIKHLQSLPENASFSAMADATNGAPRNTKYHSAFDVLNTLIYAVDSHSTPVEAKEQVTAELEASIKTHQFTELQKLALRSFGTLQTLEQINMPHRPASPRLQPSTSKVIEGRN